MFLVFLTFKIKAPCLQQMPKTITKVVYYLDACLLHLPLSFKTRAKELTPYTSDKLQTINC